ncbi:MAG: acyl-CoA thioesterase [Bacteroidota bacterium]
MRWIRLLKPLIFSRFQTKLTISQTSTLQFSVWLSDIDATIMNHAAMMTVFETGRIDYMVRTGFFKLARHKKWYVPIASINVQFFRPLKVFQKAVLTTRVFHMTEHFIFMEQKITRSGKDVAICMVKCKIKSGRENITTQEVLNFLNAKNIPAESKELVELFEKQDKAFKEKFFEKE